MELVTRWTPELLASTQLDSRRSKEQWLAHIDGLLAVPEESCLHTLSLGALSGGLLSGALDGAALYAAGASPEPCQVPESCQALLTLFAEYLRVADGPWRQLDADALQLQAGYGKYLNRATQEENVEFLRQPGRTLSHARRALLETFRTGYSLGLIDSAIVFLTGERPDPLASP
jgi:hypothetical protein